jgi:AcrR family transcriptional regulator
MKEKILKTALEQFFKYGIRDISIQELVMPLGISTKTIYKYFKNKEEILEEVLKLLYNQRYDYFKKLIDSQDSVTLLFDVWYFAVEKEFDVNNKFYHDLVYYYPELHRKSETELDRKFWDEFLKVFQRGIEKELLRDDILPEVAMEGISVLFANIARTNQFSRFNLSSFVIFCNTIVPFIRGFCTEKGRRQLEEHIQSVNQLHIQHDMGRSYYQDKQI